MTRRGWATGLFVTAAVMIVAMVAFSFVTYTKFSLPNDKRVWLVPHLVRDGAIDSAKWNERSTTFNRLLRLDSRGRLDEVQAQYNIAVIAEWIAPRPPPRLAAGSLWLGVVALGSMFFAALAALNGVRQWERRCLLLTIALMIVSIPFMYLASLSVGFAEVKDRTRAHILVNYEVIRGEQWDKVAAELGTELPNWPVATPSPIDPYGNEADWARIEILKTHLTKIDTTSQPWLAGALWCSIGALVLLIVVLVLRRVGKFPSSTVGEPHFVGVSPSVSDSSDVTTMGTVGGKYSGRPE